MIPIKYIGHRPVYRDGACGSELVFEQGKTLLVPDESAAKMLRHPSVYVPGDVADVVAGESSEKRNPATDDDDPGQTMRDSIAQMNKDALAEFAKTHYQVDLDKRANVGELRAKVSTLFDQFGAD